MYSHSSLMVSVVAVCAWCLAVATPLAAQPTARVTIARGEVSADGQPLRQGGTVGFGSTIQTGPTAFATVRVEWRTAGGSCFKESMFGFGVSFPVPRPRDNEPCDSNAFTSYAGVSSKVGSAAVGKGDNGAVTAAAAAAYAEFDALKVALAAGMVLRDNENRRATDYNRPGQRVASAAACAAICARDARCNAMTFITDQHICWLKQERGEPTNAPGMISAVKPINPRSVVPPGR